MNTKDKSREAFEAEFPRPDGVGYDDKINEYFMKSRSAIVKPNEIAHNYQSKWEGYQAALSTQPEGEAVFVQACRPELVEAIKKNVRAFRHKESGDIEYVLLKADLSEWEDVMIIPNISDAAIDAAIKAKE